MRLRANLLAARRSGRVDTVKISLARYIAVTIALSVALGLNLTPSKFVNQYSYGISEYGWPVKFYSSWHDLFMEPEETWNGYGVEKPLVVERFGYVPEHLMTSDGKLSVSSLFINLSILFTCLAFLIKFSIAPYQAAPNPKDSSKP